MMKPIDPQSLTSLKNSRAEDWVALIAQGGEEALEQLLNVISSNSESEWEHREFRLLEEIYRTRFRQLMSVYSWPGPTKEQLATFAKHLNLATSILPVSWSGFRREFKHLEKLVNDAFDEIQLNEEREKEGKDALWLDLTTGMFHSPPSWAVEAKEAKERLAQLSLD